MKFFLEGQEEIGSPQLPGLIANQRDLLACDLVISADGGQYGEEQPALTIAFKGMKTVLPNEAHAKITCRLVTNQDSATIVDLLTRHVECNTPPGVRAAVHPFSAAAKPYLISVDHWGNRAAKSVLTEMYGKAPYLLRLGGSIPVCEIFLSVLGAYTVNFAFALLDEQMHAPDEFFRLSSFRRGQVAYGKLLHELEKWSNR